MKRAVQPTVLGQRFFFYIGQAQGKFPFVVTTGLLLLLVVLLRAKIFFLYTPRPAILRNHNNNARGAALLPDGIRRLVTGALWNAKRAGGMSKSLLKRLPGAAQEKKGTTTTAMSLGFGNWARKDTKLNLPGCDSLHWACA